MPNVINDGGKSYGSSSLVLTKPNGSGGYISRGTYASDDLEFTRGTNEKLFTDGSEITVGQVFTAAPIRGTATLQLLTAATESPEIGDRFQKDAPNGTNKWWIITSVGRRETKSDETKVPVAFAQVINSSVTIDGVAYTFA